MPDDTPLIAAPLDWVPRPGAVAVPASGVIDIWRIDLVSQGAAAADAAGVLSADELARADRYRLERHRARFILGRAALREIIGAYCGKAPREVVFAIEPAGRPALVGRPDIVFSYSKTNTAAVLAVTGAGRLGADIEPVAEKPDLDLIIADQYSPIERDQLSRLAVAARLEGFYRGWTAKEALVKATGEGLTSLLPKITAELDPAAPARLIDGPVPYRPDIWRLKAFAAAPGVLGALALDRPIDAIRAIVR